MRRIIASIALAAASVVLGAAGPMHDTDKCFANAGLQAQRLPSAEIVEACTRILQKAGEDFTLTNEAGIRNNRGIAYLELGQLDQAMVDLNAALRISPNLIEAVNNRGSIYLKKRDFDAAIADYSSVIAREPKHISAYVNRGVAYLKKHDLTAALRDFDAAKSMDAESYAAFVNASLALLERGDVAGATSQANTAMRIHPTYFWSYNLYCIIKATSRQDFEGAARDCNEALERSDNNYVVYQSLGLLAFQTGRFRDAVADYDRFLMVEPNEPVALYMRGMSKRNLGDVSGADRDMTAAKALDPRVEILYAGMGSGS